MTDSLLTEEDLLIAARFKAAWLRLKGSEGKPRSLKEFGKLLNISQPALSRMMTPKDGKGMKIPLPLFAGIEKVLGVAPEEIDPSYSKKVRNTTPPAAITGTFRGALPNLTRRVELDFEGLDLIQMDITLNELITENSTLVIDKKSEINPGDKVYLRLADRENLLGIFISSGNDVIVKEIGNDSHTAINKSQVLNLTKVVSIVF